MSDVSVSLMAEDVSAHVNRVPFVGCLAYVDVPSDAAPAGAKGHRVQLMREAVEKNLHTLLGMGINFGELTHDASKKVGLITTARIEKNDLIVKGWVYENDFKPEIRKIREGLYGMSYELTEARIVDLSADTWALDDFTFTGAAVLRRDIASYKRTWINIGKLL